MKICLPSGRRAIRMDSCFRASQAAQKREAGRSSEGSDQIKAVSEDSEEGISDACRYCMIRMSDDHPFHLPLLGVVGPLPVPCLKSIYPQPYPSLARKRATHIGVILATIACPMHQPPVRSYLCPNMLLDQLFDHPDQNIVFFGCPPLTGSARASRAKEEDRTHRLGRFISLSFVGGFLSGRSGDFAFFLGRW